MLTSNEPDKSWKREVDVDLLLTANACLCFVTIALSKDKHFNTGLEIFAAKTFQKGEITKSYYEMLVYHDLSSREHTRVDAWGWSPESGLGAVF